MRCGKKSRTDIYNRELTACSSLIHTASDRSLTEKEQALYIRASIRYFPSTIHHEAPPHDFVPGYCQRPRICPRSSRPRIQHRSRCQTLGGRGRTKRRGLPSHKTAPFKREAEASPPYKTAPFKRSSPHKTAPFKREAEASPPPHDRTIQV